MWDRNLKFRESGCKICRPGSMRDMPSLRVTRALGLPCALSHVVSMLLLFQLYQFPEGRGLHVCSLSVLQQAEFWIGP